MSRRENHRNEQQKDLISEDGLLEAKYATI